MALTEIERFRGDDWRLRLTLKLEVGSTVEVYSIPGGATILSSLRPQFGDEADPALWQGTLGEGITVVDAPTGVVQVIVPRAVTETLATGGYLMDIEVTNTLRDTGAKWIVKCVSDVTYPA